MYDAWGARGHGLHVTVLKSASRLSSRVLPPCNGLAICLKRLLWLLLLLSAQMTAVQDIRWDFKNCGGDSVQARTVRLMRRRLLFFSGR